MENPVSFVANKTGQEKEKMTFHPPTLGSGELSHPTVGPSHPTGIDPPHSFRQRTHTVSPVNLIILTDRVQRKGFFCCCPLEHLKPPCEVAPTLLSFCKCLKIGSAHWAWTPIHLLHSALAFPTYNSLLIYCVCVCVL